MRQTGNYAKEREITGLGIAMGAFTGVGLYKDIREAAAEMSFAGKIYEPKHDCQAFYEDWLESIKREMKR